MTQSLQRLTSASGLLLASLTCVCAAAAVDLPLPVATLQRSEPVDFHGEIMPLLRRSCMACHHEKLSEGGLNLETHAKILAGGDSGPAVVASDPATSLLISRASGKEEPLMPPEDNAAGAMPFSSEELGLISLWIQQGAKAGEQTSAESLKWQPIAPTLRPIYAVDASPDGHFVASSRGNQVVIHDAHSHEEVGRLVDPNLPATAGEHAADVDLVQSLAFSPDGNTIATGGFRSVKLWIKHYQEFPLANTPWAAAVGPVAVSADATRVATASAIDDIEIWNTDQNELVAVLRGHSQTICGVGFSQADARVISGDRSGRIILWNAATGEKIAETAAPRPLVRLAATADARTAVALDIQGQITVYKVADGEPVSLQTAELEAIKPIRDAIAVAWISADAPRLAVATEAAAVTIIDMAGGQVTATLQPGAAADVLAVNASGDRLATAARDGEVKVWNTQSGELVRTLQGDPRRVRRAEQMARNAKRQQGHLERLKAQSEELQKRLTSEEEAIVKATEARDKGNVQVAEQTQKLQEPTEALAAAEAMVAANKQRVEELEKKNGEQDAAVVAAKADEVAKAEQAAKAAEAAAAQQAANPDDAAAAAEPLQAAEAAKALAAAATEATQAAEAAAAESKTQLEAARAEATTLATALEEKKKALAAAQEAKDKADSDLAKLQSALDALGEARDRLNKAIAEQQSRTAQETDRNGLLEAIHQQHQRDLAQKESPTTAIAFSPQGQMLATAQRDGSVRVYFAEETVARIVLNDPSGRGATIGRLHFVGEDTLVSLSSVGPPAAWQLRPTWTLQRSIGSPEDSPISDRVTALDFHPEGNLLAVGSGPASRAGQLQIFTTTNGRQVRDFPDVHSDTVLSVRFSPDGRTLASSAADKIIRISNVADGQAIRSLEGHTHHVLAVAWHDNAVTLASAGADQSIKIWDTQSGEQKQSIGGIPKEATALRFVKETSELLTAAADGNVRLHNADNGAAIRTFSAAGDFLFSLAVSPDGTKVLAGGQSGVLRSWVVADGQLAAEMK